MNLKMASYFIHQNNFKFNLRFETVVKLSMLYSSWLSSLCLTFFPWLSSRLCTLHYGVCILSIQYCNFWVVPLLGAEPLPYYLIISHVYNKGKIICSLSPAPRLPAARRRSRASNEPLRRLKFHNHEEGPFVGPPSWKCLLSPHLRHY